MKLTQVNIMKICYCDPINCKNVFIYDIFVLDCFTGYNSVICNKLYQTFSILH